MLCCFYTNIIVVVVLCVYAVTMAKGVGNGFPLGVVVTTPGQCVLCVHKVNCVCFDYF